MGRSGTVFTSELLSKATDVTVKHEHIGDKEFSLLSRYMQPNVYTIPYLEKAKQKIDAAYTTSTFIDVNGYLRNATDSLQQVFGEVMIYHLVRDPRDVVRSLMVRRSPKSIKEVPLNREEMEPWLNGDKFYQICWNWMDTTRNLMGKNLPMLRFEDLIADYDYLFTHLLEPVGLKITKAAWEVIRSNKKNKTQSSLYRRLYAKIKQKEYIEDSLPEFDQWPNERKQTIREVCGAVAKACGYTL